MQNGGESPPILLAVAFAREWSVHVVVHHSASLFHLGRAVNEAGGLNVPRITQNSQRLLCAIVARTTSSKALSDRARKVRLRRGLLPRPAAR
jgi:hypothetical protein